MKVRTRPAARADLAEQIAFFVERGGCDLAKRFVGAVWKTLEVLVMAPRLGKASELRNPMLQGIRSWPVDGFSQYLVFYRITTTDVEIVRLIHGARDIPRLLEDEDLGSATI